MPRRLSSVPPRLGVPSLTPPLPQAQGFADRGSREPRGAAPVGMGVTL